MATYHREGLRQRSQLLQLELDSDPGHEEGLRESLLEQLQSLVYQRGQMPPYILL